MKRISSIVLSLALVLSVVAPVAASAQSMSGTFNTTLTMGSTGSAVVALQSFLVSKGLLTMPAGVSMGYFGGLTRSAVAAYQISKGIQPAAGYFGPVTRGYANADLAAMSGGNTSGTTNPGCPAGALFNTQTAAPCNANNNNNNNNNNNTTSGVEGVVDVLLSPTPSNNSSVLTSTDVPVYGVEFRGRISPVSIQTLDLEVSVSPSVGNFDNPGTLINTIKIWDGSNVLATVPVSLSTFIRDSANKYYVRLSGLNFVVPAGATKTLTVSFSTNYIDTSRTVIVNAYTAGNNIRAVSGNGISSFYTLNSARTHVFQKPGNSTVTVSSVSSPLRSQNVRLNTSNMVYADAVLFNVKSENADSKITTVVATSTVTGVSASELVYELYDGSTKIDSRSGAASVTFANLSVNVGKDTTKTLKIVVGFPASSTASAVASARITVDSVSTDNANGSNSTTDGNIIGATQYAYGQSAMFALNGTPTLTAVKNDPATTTTMTATFAISTTPRGGDFVLTSASSTIAFLNSVGTVVKAVPATVTKNTTSNIPDGAPETVTISAVLSSADAAITSGANQYRATIAGIDWTVGSNAVKQTYGFEDYITNLTTVTK